MQWNYVDVDGEPTLAKRVLVETAEGSLLFAKRVNRPNGSGHHYIDDQSLPIRSPIIKWKDIKG